jgi:hypothetical protein
LREREWCRISQSGILAIAKPWPGVGRIPWEERSVGVPDDRGHFLDIFSQFDKTLTNLGKVMEML